MIFLEHFEVLDLFRANDCEKLVVLLVPSWHKQWKEIP